MPTLTRRETVVAHVCQCGHLRNDHRGTVIRIGPRTIRGRGRADCCDANCQCHRFVERESIRVQAGLFRLFKAVQC